MDDLTISSISAMQSANIETMAQVKLFKGANEQLEAVANTLIQSIPDVSDLTGKGASLDIVA